MFKMRPVFLALLVTFAVMSGVISAAAQATNACPLLDSVITADGFQLSVFGDGSVAPAAITEQVAVTLSFRVDNQSPSCAGNQSTILIVDARDVTIAPPYHVRVNEAWITFTDQFALGLAPTGDRMILSPLDGTVVVMSEASPSVSIVPLGYTTQVNLDGSEGAVAGDWHAKGAMDTGSLTMLRNLAVEHPELALATPSDEQVMTAVQTVKANPPATVAVPGGDQPAQTSTGGQPVQTAGVQQPGQTSSGGQSGQTSTGQQPGQTSPDNSSGQTPPNNRSGQTPPENSNWPTAPDDSSGQTPPDNSNEQTTPGGQTSTGTGNPGLAGTVVMPHENICAYLGPGCLPVENGPQTGGTGPNPCNGCEPAIAIDPPYVIIDPSPDVKPAIGIGLNDRIHIDDLPNERMPQVNRPGY